MKAAAEGRGDTYEAPVRPIVIGDALLRVAEKAYCIEAKDVFAAHLMPYQVGVAVPGGMNMWATVVECLLQRDTSNVLVAVDLENMFNAVDRDALVDELRRHELLQPLARYVVALYPPGMISVAKVAGEWRRISIQRRTVPLRRCKIRNVGQFPPRRCISDVRLFPPRSCNVRPFPPGRHRDASSREEAPLP